MESWYKSVQVEKLLDKNQQSDAYSHLYMTLISIFQMDIWTNRNFISSGLLCIFLHRNVILQTVRAFLISELLLLEEVVERMSPQALCCASHTCIQLRFLTLTGDVSAGLRYFTSVLQNRSKTSLPSGNAWYTYAPLILVFFRKKTESIFLTI